MTKLFLVVFAGMTVAAAYLTAYDAGGTTAVVQKHSIRTASSRSGVGYVGGSRGGYRSGK